MLGVGLKAGIIEERLYTVFVLMALVTSMTTGPLLSAVRRAATHSEERESWLDRRAARAPAA